MSPIDSPNDKSQDILERQLSVYLAEVDIVFAQMHTRIQIISAYTGVTIGLAAALIAAVGSSEKMQDQMELYAIFPYPFLFFGFQILREDFLMASHDRYFYRLRQKALIAASLDLRSAEALGFLPSMKAYKMGGNCMDYSEWSALCAAGARVARVRWVFLRIW